jgi:hypothetical protein
MQCVPDSLKEMEVFDSMFDLSLDWGVPDAITFYIEMYSENNEIEYLGLVAILIIYEIQHPSFPDTSYSEEHETISLEGYSVKDVEGFLNE